MITIVPKITEKQFKQDCLHGGCIWYVRKYARPADKIGWFYANYNCDDIKCYNSKTPFELKHNDDIFPHHYFIIHPNNTYEDANGIFQTKSDLFRAWEKSCDVSWHLDKPQIYDANNQVAVVFNLDAISIRKYYNLLSDSIDLKTIFNDYKTPIIYHILRADDTDETDYYTFMDWKDDGAISDETMTHNFNQLYKH